MATVRSFVESERDHFVTELFDWLSIPSISADPTHLDDVRRSANWLASALRAAGFPTVEIWETPGGRPAVFAEWPRTTRTRRQLLCTAITTSSRSIRWTLDDRPVRAIRPRRARSSVVEAPTTRARSTSTPSVYALTWPPPGAPRRCHAQAADRGEESGSPYLVALVTEHRDRLLRRRRHYRHWHVGPDTPSTCTAMRGLTECQVDVHGPDIDLHSGSFGGAVRNPLSELCRHRGALHDGEGRIAIPGFYDDVSR